ncbi:unnamed protein product, partial [Coregonus sp. 'balchen']
PAFLFHSLLLPLKNVSASAEDESDHSLYSSALQLCCHVWSRSMRWLDVSVANLTCTQYWVIYLRVLQDAVWPGGSLPALPRPERSHQQKEDTKQHPVRPHDLLSDMLGSDKYQLSWQTALESLQDPYINRHLVYCIWDLLLEFLVPETSEEDFQKTLLQ